MKKAIIGIKKDNRTIDNNRLVLINRKENRIPETKESRRATSKKEVGKWFIEGEREKVIAVNRKAIKATCSKFCLLISTKLSSFSKIKAIQIRKTITIRLRGSAKNKSDIVNIPPVNHTEIAEAAKDIGIFFDSLKDSKKTANANIG
jgi:hypothetical protein